jgi:hypothetical protein
VKGGLRRLPVYSPWIVLHHSTHDLPLMHQWECNEVPYVYMCMDMHGHICIDLAQQLMNAHGIALGTVTRIMASKSLWTLAKAAGSDSLFIQARML